MKHQYSQTFLSAKRPLTKTFYTSGECEPYPLIEEFTSFVVGYDTLPELMETLEIAGSTGACMLKGALSKEIIEASRRGLTDPNANTSLLVIDYDSDSGFPDIPDLLGEIDPLLRETDYIFQHSASSGITGKSGIRGHVFILLAEPTSPNILKQWLKKINLTVESFAKKIRLSRNAMSLCYALDITVCQNDKLIYIAPPTLIGMNNPIKQRFTFHKGEYRTYAFSALVSSEHNRTKEHKLIGELQDGQGLTKRTPKYKNAGDYEILINPATCAVTNTKAGEKFVRINLNGGDSFAYWYAKDNPELLHNFKGEPSCYIRDIAPEYYEQLKRVERALHMRPFVFRDVAANVYYNAEYDEELKILGLCFPSSKPALNDFLTQRGSPMQRNIPDWEVNFDPTNDTLVDFPKKRLNLFKPTPYLLNVTAEHKGEFPIIEHIIRHVCVDEATYQHFIKWLAHIVQFRTKTQTAWIWSGEEGTGKGTIYHQILVPILGADQTFMITQDQAEEQFNGYLRSNMLLFLDEGDIESSKQADRMLAKFRSIITEPTVPIRMMRANTIQVPNYTNLIVATNKCMPIKLTEGDRRYNVAPRQNRKLEITPEEYEAIPSELTAFTGYLKAQQIQAKDALRILQSQARKDLQELSKTVADQFFIALKEGDLDFFAEGLLESVPLNTPGYIPYQKIIAGWMAAAGQELVVDMKDVIQVYQFLSGNDSITDKRFGHLAARQDLIANRIRIEGVLRRVYKITFRDNGYEDWLNRNPKTNILPMRATK